MNMDHFLNGLSAVALVIIADKNEFTDREGKTVRLIKVSGFGFTKSIVAETATEFESWPEKDQKVKMSCSMAAQKDGSFKLGSPIFQPLTPAK